MANDSYCAIHGPYPSSYNECPRCNNAGGGRPVAPPPLDDEDNLPTDLNRAGQAGRAPSNNSDDNALTMPPSGSRGGRRILDIDDDITNPFRNDDSDDTQPNFDPKTEVIQAIFWVKEGPRRGKIEKLKKYVRIGRQDGDIIINDPKVSRNHAVIAFKAEHYVIVDSLSENGTFINGERITGETLLKENDIVKIGDTTFVVKLLD
jgi:hypothetical protein